MSTYTISGSGNRSLTSGTVALYVSVTSPVPKTGNGGAFPTDLFGNGVLRPGDATGYWEPFPIIGGPQWMPLPRGTLRVGYSIPDGGTVQLDEVFGSSPLAFPLASLPDVAIASPANAELLTYDSSTSKWKNAAAPSGGGGVGGIIGTYRCIARRAAAVSIGNNATVRVSWDTSVLDNDSMLQVGGSSPWRVTFTHAGTYLIHYAVMGTGGAGFQLLQAPNTDSTSHPGNSVDWSGGYPQGVTHMTFYVATAGQWMTFYAYNGATGGTMFARLAVISL